MELDLSTPDGLRRARESLGVSQYEFAAILGFSPENGRRYVRAWEVGEMEPTGPARVAMRYLFAITRYLQSFEGAPFEDQAFRAVYELREELPEILKR